MIKFVKKIAAMALCLAIGISATAYASPETNNTTKKENINQYNKGANEGNKGYSNQSSHGGKQHKGKVLEKLGITREELEEAKRSGKSFFDIAKSKGHSESEVKKIMIEDRNNYIDQAVKDKKVTKEKADQIKKIVNEKIKNWDGNLKENSNAGNSGSNINDGNAKGNESKINESGTNNGTTNEGNEHKDSTDGDINKNDQNKPDSGSIDNGTNKDNNKSNSSTNDKTQNNTTSDKSKSTR